MRKMPKEISFACSGHANVLATHGNSLEFTKDTELSVKGDCILGVGCDFNAGDLADIARNSGNFEMNLEAGDARDSVHGRINAKFGHRDEIVMRIGEFSSERTFGIRCDKPAAMINRRLIENLKKGARLNVRIKAV